MAPGDIILRPGYHHDFPKVSTPTNEQVQEALSLNKRVQEERNAALNETRRQENVEIGDTVIVKNHQRTKFKPIYGPEPLEVVEVEKGGATLVGQEGSSYRRYLDDMKVLQNAEGDDNVDQNITNEQTNTETSDTENPITPTPTQNTTTDDQTTRRSMRHRTKPSYLNDYIKSTDGTTA